MLQYAKVFVIALSFEFGWIYTFVGKTEYLHIIYYVAIWIFSIYFINSIQYSSLYFIIHAFILILLMLMNIY